jgi:hypothetical protein
MGKYSDNKSIFNVGEDDLDKIFLLWTPIERSAVYVGCIHWELKL